MQKKTYVFDETTLEILDDLKCKLKQNETSIIKEAIRMYRDTMNGKDEIYRMLHEIVYKLEYIIEKVERLSFQLGKCVERNRQLEEQLRKLNADQTE